MTPSGNQRPICGAPGTLSLGKGPPGLDKPSGSGQSGRRAARRGARLALGGLDGVGAVDDVAADIDGKVAADGARRRDQRVGGTDQGAALLDDVLALPHLQHDGRGCRLRPRARGGALRTGGRVARRRVARHGDDRARDDVVHQAREEGLRFRSRAAHGVAASEQRCAAALRRAEAGLASRRGRGASLLGQVLVVRLGQLLGDVHQLQG